MTEKEKEKETAFEMARSFFWMGMLFVAIFSLCGAYCYFKKPIGLPCSFVKRIGVFKKTRNAMFVVDGIHEFIVAWPTRHGFGGAWNELKGAQNGMRIESNVCSNELVRVALEGQEVYKVTSSAARKKDLSDAKFSLALAVFGFVLTVWGRYKLRKF